MPPIQTPMLLIVGIIGSLGALSFGYDNVSKWPRQFGGNQHADVMDSFTQGWWGLILGAGHFNQAYGTLEVVAKDGTVSTKLSSVQQSSGTALGTAGIMIGLMVRFFSPPED
jgi:MFS transporter, SP family, sugar:H+ symporter